MSHEGSTKCVSDAAASRETRRSPSWFGPAIALALAFLAFAVQWGVFNARMDNLTARVAEWMAEQAENRRIQQSNAMRISNLEGRLLNWVTGK